MGKVHKGTSCLCKSNYDSSLYADDSLWSFRCIYRKTEVQIVPMCIHTGLNEEFIRVLCWRPVSACVCLFASERWEKNKVVSKCRAERKRAAGLGDGTVSGGEEEF